MRALPAIMGVILPSKGHMRLIDRDNPMIGYGNTMNVAGEILEYKNAWRSQKLAVATGALAAGCSEQACSG